MRLPSLSLEYFNKCMYTCICSLLLVPIYRPLIHGTTKPFIRTFQQMYVYMHLFTFSGPDPKPCLSLFEHILPPLTEDDHICLFEPCFVISVAKPRDHLHLNHFWIFPRHFITWCAANFKCGWTYLWLEELNNWSCNMIMDAFQIIR